MREIRFRTWDGKKMLGVVAWRWKEGRCVEIELDDGHRLASDNCLRRYALMQSVDLKDNAGHKIYEGDIVGGRHGLWVVTWHTTGFDFVSPDGNGNDDLLPHNGREWTFDGSVIGNIYENPKLLKS
jgi:hypothetical protein